MHEIESNVAADHVDRHILRDAYVFHTRTHHRDSVLWSAMPPSVTNLSDKHISSFEWMEHVFGGERIEQSKHAPPVEKYRKSSASAFCALEGLAYETLMYLLAASFGESQDAPHTRPYPSGGAMYSGQVTIYTKHVYGLERGVYHYLPRTRQLERLKAQPEQEIEKHLFFGDNKPLRDYAFFVLYSSMPTLAIAKYGMRGYRLSCIEIGSMYQSLIIQSEKIGLSSRVWGGFADEALTLAMGIDPRVSWPFICHLVGREAP